MSSERSSDDRDEPVRQVSDELLRKASEGPVRRLPDALFGGPVTPVDPAGESDAASESGDADDDGGSTGPPAVLADAPTETAENAEPAAGAREDSVPSGSETTPSTATHASVSGDAAVADDAAAAPDAHRKSDTGSGAATPGERTVSSAAVDAVSGIDDAVSADAQPSIGDTAGAPEASARPVLVVIADSLSYFGPKGGLPADHPRIWPNLVAAELDWDVELVARIGWTCRDAYWALIGDPRVWAAVPRAGAVVLATGGMDTLPSPLPTALREMIRYLRPPVLRRQVRTGYQWLQPRLSKLGRPVALPPHVSIDYLEQSRHALAQLRPELPVVSVLPSVHDCEAYGKVHSGRAPAVRALQEWSAKTGVPLVDLGEAVRDDIFSGEANPDGIHWGWEGHAAVARAMVKVLSEVRSVEAGA
nr:diglucosylglycerate octanoyltransferase [Nocardia sp. MDA0666]